MTQSFSADMARNPTALKIQENKIMTNYSKLLDFANAIFDIANWPEGGDIDGFELQDIAEKHGLLVPETRHEPCGAPCNCENYGCFSKEEWQDGIKCFHKADWLLSATSDNYQRPELTDEDKKQAEADAQKLIRKYGIANLPKMLAALAVENVRLVKEINQHRAARGIDPLPTFEV